MLREPRPEVVTGHATAPSAAELTIAAKGGKVVRFRGRYAFS
jgi:hypothetical protein